MVHSQTFTRERPKPHVVVIHRWRDSYAEYARYIDHDRAAVTYVSTDVGCESVPGEAAAISTVSRISDQDEVEQAVASHVAEFGGPASVVALKEDDLLLAARLREKFGCPGPRTAELLPFSDKYLMCTSAAQAGIATPAFDCVSRPDQVIAFGEQHGWPVVVKPRSSSSSEGVVVLDGPGAIESVDFSDGRLRMVQVYDDRPIYHVDGVYTEDGLGPWKVSRYLNSCLGFREGSFLGSVEDHDPELAASVGAFTERLLRALARGPVVFHLEVFALAGQCALLEVAARAGGAEIPFLWREVHGFDLMRAAFDIQMGRKPRIDDSTDLSRAAGWLLVPAPAHRPCQITEITSMTSKKGGPYAQVIPELGDVLPAAEAYYEHVGGRFRFQGATTAEVGTAIAETASRFRISGTPIEFAARG